MSNMMSNFPSPRSKEVYKDVLIFEERLKQNAERLQSQKRKYELFLGSLILLILYLIYAVFIKPSIYQLVHYGNVTSLLVSLVTLGLFFVSGMYSEKIAYAYKFVPQANRALRPFNIYLNTRTHPRFSRITSFFRLNPTVPPSTSTSTPSSPISPDTTSTTVTTHTNINATTTTTTESTPSSPASPVPLSRRTSSSSSHSSTSVRSSRGNRSPPGSPVIRSISPPLPPPNPNAIRGVPILAPIPPASNPRGELIFSSRVSAGFREGYERYRGEWEKRREEQLDLGKKKNWFTKWISGNSNRKNGSVSSGSEKDRDSSVEKEKPSRGRSASITSSTKGASRQSSPLRLVNARPSRGNSNVSSTSTSPSNSPPDSPRLSSSVKLKVPSTSPETRIKAENFNTFLQTMEKGRGNE